MPARTPAARRRPNPAITRPAAEVAPIVPATLPGGAPRGGFEFTLRASVIGSALALLLGTANMYVGMRAGLTVSASIPAAVLSFAVLRLFRRRDIRENNIVQTIASAASSLSAGIIFTVPALVFVGVWSEIRIVDTLVIALAGGLLGVLFSIPLRKALIIDQKLPFPEGTACAAVLKAGHGGGSGARLLLAGAVAGGLFAFLQLGLRLFPLSAEAAGRAGGAILYAGTELSLILVGVGFLVGLRIASLIFLGGAFAWFVVMPLLSAFGPSLGVALPDTSALVPVDAAGAIWSAKIRLIGAGAMFTGGVLALWRLRTSLATALHEGLKGYGAAARGRRVEDIPVPYIVVGVVLLAVPLAVMAFLNLPAFGHAALAIGIILVAGFFLSAVAGYMAGMVGSSNNPVSGVTIIALTATGLLLLLVGVTGPAGMLGALIVGAAVATAAAISGDNMQDLKTGHMVGATPWKQQLGLMLGVVTLGLAAPFVLALLDGAFGLGSAVLPAPQANLMAAITSAIFGSGLDLPMMGFGAATGVGLALVGLPVLPVAVGMYLPVGLSVAIGAGGVLRHLVARHAARRGADAEAVENRGTVIASGVIAGEAVAGVLLAGLIVLDGEMGGTRSSLVAPLVVALLAALGVLVVAGRRRAGVAVAAALVAAGIAVSARVAARGSAFDLDAGPVVGLLVMAYASAVIAYLAMRPQMGRG